jgi:hypothetical protein
VDVTLNVCTITLYLILVPSEETKMDASVKVVKTVLLNMTQYVPYVYKYESVKASYRYG